MEQYSPPTLGKEGPTGQPNFSIKVYYTGHALDVMGANPHQKNKQQAAEVQRMRKQAEQMRTQKKNAGLM